MRSGGAARHQPVRHHVFGMSVAARLKPLIRRRIPTPKDVHPRGMSPLTLSPNTLHVVEVGTFRRRQVASLDRRISTGSNPSRESVMLRMVLLGLLIPLGVGVLAAIELRTPPCIAIAVVQPETTAGISDSHGALAKADRFEVTYAKSETPTQPGPVDERIAPSDATAVDSSRVINRHRHDPKTKKVATAALSKSKPKTTDIKRTAILDRSKAAGDNEPCRLSAFGGLRKALNSSGCEI